VRCVLRRIIPIFALVMCACVALVWLLSAHSAALLMFADTTVARRYAAVSCIRGHVEFVAMSSVPPDSERTGDYSRFVRGDPYVLGTHLGTIALPMSSQGYVAVIPYWLLMVAAAAYPVTCGVRSWWLRRRSDLRAGRGMCLVCGYDVRATPARCPECGAVARPPAEEWIKGRESFYSTTPDNPKR
jgi:hypothetical protein